MNSTERSRPRSQTPPNYGWIFSQRTKPRRIYLHATTALPPFHELEAIRPLGPSYCCEAAEYSASPGGEGWDEGGRSLFPQGHIFPLPSLRFTGTMRENISGRSLPGGAALGEGESVIIRCIP